MDIYVFCSVDFAEWFRRFSLLICHKIKCNSLESFIIYHQSQRQAKICLASHHCKFFLTIYTCQYIHILVYLFYVGNKTNNATDRRCKWNYIYFLLRTSIYRWNYISAFLHVTVWYKLVTRIMFWLNLKWASNLMYVLLENVYVVCAYDLHRLSCYCAHSNNAILYHPPW